MYPLCEKLDYTASQGFMSYQLSDNDQIFIGNRHK